jgi:stage II sporulation protein D
MPCRSLPVKLFLIAFVLGGLALSTIFESPCHAYPEQLTVHLFSSATKPILQIRLRGPFALLAGQSRAYRKYQGASSRTYPSGDYIVSCDSGFVRLRRETASQVIAREPELNLMAIVPQGIALQLHGGERNYNGSLIIRSLPVRAAPNMVAHGKVRTAQNYQLFVTNTISRKDYIAAVIASEMPVKAGLEALKAQAVLVNTAIDRVRDGVEITDSTEFQSYKGVPLSRPLASHAAALSANQVLVFKGAPIHVFFHSTCAGMTSAVEDIFGGTLAESSYLRNIPCKYCKRSPFCHEHTCQIPKQHFATIFGAEQPMILSRDKAQRPTLIRYLYHGKQVESSGYLFWLRLGQKFGWDKVPGTKFSVSTKPDLVEIKSTGAGHGVGLCQWGAMGMAESGKTYKEILEYYFPGTKVVMSPARAGKLKH